MKRNLLAGAAALAYARQAFAQSALSTSTIIVDMYDPSCSDIDIITDYETVTVTTCPACTEQPGPITQHTTVYTTTFDILCSTGLSPQAYTITETCTGESPTWSSGPSYVPQGFTETVKICTVCGNKPTMVTLTEPCDETGAPAAPGNPGIPQAPAQPTSPGGPVGGVPGQSWAAPPYPTGANSTLVKCPGSPYCTGTSASGPSAGVPGSGAPGSGATNPQSPPIKPNDGSRPLISWPSLMVALGLGTLGALVWL